MTDDTIQSQTQSKTQSETPSKKIDMTKVSSKKELLALYEVEAQPLLTKLDSVSNKRAAVHRRNLYKAQQQRTRLLYEAEESIKPTYLIQALKPQLEEYQHYQMSLELDKRAVVEDDNIRRLWEQIHIVDDLLADLVQRMPSHEAVGWLISSQSKNHLRLPTVGRVRTTQDVIADQTSINSYVLGHFGVMSFTNDKGYFIGHVLGYLFCCYYFAHLGIAYGVSALAEDAIAEVDYASLKTPYLVRLIQTLDVHSKQRIYQLAVICARLSHYATDKRIEKMLVAEVNEFDKKLQIKHLDMLLLQGVMPEMIENEEEGEDGISK